MPLLYTIDRHRVGKALQGENLDERSLDFRRRCQGEPGSSRKVNLVWRCYRLDAGGERKSFADEVAVVNGHIAERDNDAYRQAIITPV